MLPEAHPQSLAAVDAATQGAAAHAQGRQVRRRQVRGYGQYCRRRRQDLCGAGNLLHRRRWLLLLRLVQMSPLPLPVCRHYSVLQNSILRIHHSEGRKFAVLHGRRIAPSPGSKELRVGFPVSGTQLPTRTPERAASFESDKPQKSHDTTHITAISPIYARFRCHGTMRDFERLSLLPFLSIFSG